jgi:hypothetical protein
MDKPSGRLPSLDGLRGVAALIVVVHHTLLTVPSLSVAYFLDGPAAVRGSKAWWLSWTPLHLIWAGGEAVIVFFVLSGFVLALPYVNQVLADTLDEDGGVIGSEHDGDGLIVIFDVAVSRSGRVEADVNVTSQCGGGWAGRAAARR